MKQKFKHQILFEDNGVQINGQYYTYSDYCHLVVYMNGQIVYDNDEVGYNISWLSDVGLKTVSLSKVNKFLKKQKSNSPPLTIDEVSPV